MYDLHVYLVFPPYMIFPTLRVSTIHPTHSKMLHQSSQPHFVIVTFPAQGHINPALQFAKRLISVGVAHVTFVTCVSAHRRMVKSLGSFPEGLTLAPFSDGYDDGFGDGDDIDRYMSEIRRLGTEALFNLVEKSAGEGRPISCLVYTQLLSWPGDVARELQLGSALLWIQPAMVFDVYYYYFSGYRKLIVDNIDDPDYGVELPGLPLLKAQDLPSFFHPSGHSHWFKYLEQLFESIFSTKSFPILVNTFDDLEPEGLKSVEKFDLIAIGPLIPSAFLDGKDPLDKSFGGDLFEQSKKNYIEWLDSKEKSSVVYVSFGSTTVLLCEQMEALARGLVDSGRSFLWVIRAGDKGSKEQEKEKYTEILRGEHKGMIVPWCSQVEVLAHESIGCFVTHCGWNSTLESLAMGVPVVAFPQWTDQGTNAKLIEDVWKMGVRVRPKEDNFVDGNEIVRCLDEVMEREELTENAKKWRDLAREAVKEGGSLERNLRKFVDEYAQT